jgi:hypothetical protein
MWHEECLRNVRVLQRTHLSNIFFITGVVPFPCLMYTCRTHFGPVSVVVHIMLIITWTYQSFCLFHAAVNWSHYKNPGSTKKAVTIFTPFFIDMLISSFMQINMQIFFNIHDSSFSCVTDCFHDLFNCAIGMPVV